MEKKIITRISRALMCLLAVLCVSFQSNLYAETDTHWENQDFLMLNTHSNGNGIAIVIIGDGFVTADMTKGGLYETKCRALATEFLNLPVIGDFAELFDIYAVVAVSNADGIAPGADTAFGLGDEPGDGTSVYYAQVFIDGIDEIPYDRSIIFMGKGPVENYIFWYDHCAAYSFGAVANDAYWLAHWFVGRAYVGLGDEFGGPCPLTAADLSDFQDYTGMFFNLSATDNLAQVPWKDFIGLLGYSNVGAYEGAFYCNTGFYRSEETSVMALEAANDSEIYYNAYSRWLIYKRLHEEAKLPYNFGNFLQYDIKFIAAGGEIGRWQIGKVNPGDILATLDTATGDMLIEPFGAVGGSEEALSFRSSAINHLRLTNNADGSVTVATNGNNITDPYVYINNLKSDIPGDASSIKITFEYKSTVSVTDAYIFFFAGGAHVGTSSAFALPAATDWVYGEFDLTSDILALPTFGLAGDFFRYDPIGNVDAATSVAYSITFRNLKLETAAPPKEMADFTFSTQPWLDVRDAIGNVIIKSGIGSIGESAFACSGITGIDIPESVTSIGAKAFKRAHSLTDIQVHYTDLTGITADDAFSCIDWENINLSIPEGTEAIYEAAEPWKYMLGIGTPPAGTDCDECLIPAVLSVSVTPETAEVMQGETEQFTAEVVVKDGAAQTITWKVTGGNTGTTISASGLLTVAANETATALTVTATSTFDTDKQDEATVTVVLAPAVLSVSVTPKTASVKQGETEQFTATVTVQANADNTVTWKVTGGSTGTTISAAGLLSVATDETATTLTVTATSTFDTDKHDNATITVVPAGVAIAKIPVESFTPNPNPTAGIVNINNTNGEVVEVYSISGKSLFKTNTSVIDLSAYPSGMYFIKMGDKVGKVIKQ
jgi:hypothetical protein